MKKLLLLCFLAGSLAAFADDTNLLQNGDFSSGLSEWEGDCHTPGSASDNSGATTGVVVKMRDDWTKMTQDFDAKPGNYLLTITYTVTPDFAPSQKKEDYENVTGQLELSALGAINTSPGAWLIMINDTGATHYNYWQITPTTTAGVQTVHTLVQIQTDEKKGFFLGFPPGTGTINIQNITLKAQGAAATP
jgi:hypothetical protein